MMRKPWAEEELGLLEMIATVPSLQDIAERLDRDYETVRQKLYDIKSEINNEKYENGVENGSTTKKLKRGIERANARAAMIRNLKNGQTIWVKENGAIAPCEMVILQNNGNFITCKMLKNGRIATLNRGEIISRQTLIGTLKTIKELYT